MSLVCGSDIYCGTKTGGVFFFLGLHIYLVEPNKLRSTDHGYDEQPNHISIYISIVKKHNVEL